MHVIVPLSGPDFIRQDGSLKALTSFKEQPLLKYVLNSRPWVSDIDCYTFVLFDCEKTRCFVRDHLSKWFNNYSVIYISRYSRGAAITALAGVAMNHNFSDCIVIDLADIFYKCTLNIEKLLESDLSVGGIALAFHSSNPIYSYLSTNENGKVIKAAEKTVISEYASAGTYIFRDSATLLKSISHAMENESTQTYNDLFYVCPLFNGVVAQQKQVSLEFVSDVVDIKSDNISN